jgi:hypothetical protein
MADFQNTPLLILAASGYHPFTPDAGIYAGGYQGPLYPNPTTLIMPELGFNPIVFQNPVISEYTMKTTGDIYEGLGQANPGINYRNGGHILGLLDTFARMSYGLKIIGETRNGTEGTEFGEAVPITIPVMLFNGSTFAFNSSIIYPAFSEVPSAYINSFVVGGILVLDPRTDEPFSFISPYEPGVGPITAQQLRSIFLNMSVLSYFDMPKKFRDLISDLSEFAEDFSTFSTVDLDPIKPSEEIPRLYPINQLTDEDFIQGGAKFNDTQIVTPGFQSTQFIDEGLSFNQCTVLEPLQALGVLTGDNQYHDGPTNGSVTQNEYRSLTELNSVINLVPVQSNGFQYKQVSNLFKTSTSTFVSIVGLLQYLITDVVINVSSQQETTATIDAIVTVTNPVVEGNEAGAVSNFQNKNFLAAISVNNKFTWDRNWIGIPEEDFTDLFEDSEFTTETNLLGEDPEVGTTPDAIFTYNKIISLGFGCNSIRCRFLTENSQEINYDPAQSATFIPTLDPGIIMDLSISSPSFDTITHQVSF